MTSYMAQALRLARRAQGSTSPNPPVGAVLVKDGWIVGQGYTQPPGGNHAEIEAIQQAQAAANGAHLYVTLEPCAHYGRTPPCTQAIIEAGIAAVYVAAIDSNPAVNGAGLASLSAAGLRVEQLARYRAAAEALVEAHVKFMRTGSPLVTAKFAASLDGRVATRMGDSQWITGVAARAHAHRMRATVDAIVVGVNTVLADDPALTARPRGRVQRRQPRRVVVDSLARTPATARVIGGDGCCLVAVTERACPERVQLLQQRGAQVRVFPTGPGGMVDIGALLKRLAEEGRIDVLFEGGSTLLGSAFDAGVVDKVQAYLSPRIIGGRDALLAIGGTGAALLTDCPPLERTQVRRLGDDLLVTGYVRMPQPER